MPSFPPYPGDLPTCLNPLNPRHYFLVAYWVFFRPTALKGYLYQADPGLYRQGAGFGGVLTALKMPAYQRLGFTALGSTVLIPAILGVLLVAAASALQGTPPDWPGLAVGVAAGVALGVAFGVAAVVAAVVAPVVAVGVAAVVAGGMAAGVALGVFYGVALGVAGGMTAEVAGGMAYRVMVGVALGVVLGVTVGMTGRVGFVVVFAVFFIVAPVVVSAVFSIVASVVVSGVALGMAAGVAERVAYGVALGVGSLRLPFYLLEVGGLLGLPPRGWHPLWWDELAVLPFLNPQRVIRQAWSAGETVGLQRWAQVAANLFQHWILQRGLHEKLCHAPEALPFLYRLLSDSALDVYAIAPLQGSDWRAIPSVRQVFISEVAGCGHTHARGRDEVVWRLTRPLRTQQSTPLTDFAHLLYQLIWGQYGDEALPAEFNLGQYRSVYSRLSDYPGGQEIQQSFDCMAQYLAYGALADLAQAEACLQGLPAPDDAIRPSVIQALQRFGHIGGDIMVFQAATSRVNQLAALGRATDALEDLRTYINSTVLPPEQKILQAIVRRWRQLISDAIGELGQLVIAEPIANPYVAGNPVSGELFVGREEILRELEELWLRPGQTDSVLLYGHRRMGKSSILKNLPHRLDSQCNWVVEFNLQRIGKVRSTGELLYALALEMFDRLPAAEALPVAEPDEAAFLASHRSPYQAFNRWLKQVAPHMAGRRFITAIDEFELLEVAINDQRLEADLIEYLRGLINTTDWFVIALAGLYTLQEKTRDYWNPLFGSIKPRKVSFLTPSATRRLLSQPSLDFPLDYTQDTLDEIVRLTAGQPYLVQLIGQNLVAQFNHQVFEAGQDPNRPIAMADLQAVIQSPEFFQDGGPYFTGVWHQAEDSEPPGQLEILFQLCQGDRSVSELVEATGLAHEQVDAALATLICHDVIHATEAGRYAFTVELMRRWVQRRRLNT